jgi:hypothetical protein
MKLLHIQNQNLATWQSNALCAEMPMSLFLGMSMSKTETNRVLSSFAEPHVSLIKS